jgi:hypothetical protein
VSRFSAIPTLVSSLRNTASGVAHATPSSSIKWRTGCTGAGTRVASETAMNKVLHSSRQQWQSLISETTISKTRLDPLSVWRTLWPIGTPWQMAFSLSVLHSIIQFVAPTVDQRALASELLVVETNTTTSHLSVHQHHVASLSTLPPRLDPSSFLPSRIIPHPPDTIRQAGTIPYRTIASHSTVRLFMPTRLEFAYLQVLGYK